MKCVCLCLHILHICILTAELIDFILLFICKYFTRFVYCNIIYTLRIGPMSPEVARVSRVQGD